MVTSKRNFQGTKQSVTKTEAAYQKFSLENVFWRFAANLQNTHGEVWFQ